MPLTRRQFLRTTAAASIATGFLPSALAQTDSKVVLALVGAAHIHAPGLAEILKARNDTMVKSVWDHDAARAEKYAKQLGGQAVSNVQDIWSDPEIKAVVIYSETIRHPELVAAAAKAGKHMFVEKPLGITGKESLAMAEAIEKAGLLFTTGYFMRTDPKHLFLKGEIAKGNFGKITRVRGSNCHSGALEGWFDTDYRWMTDPKLSGVGAFGDLGTHKLDILMWLFGDLAAVTGEVSTVTGRYGNVDETGEALLRFKSGILGTLAAGWVDVEDPVQLLISGTEGHATIVDNHLYYRSKKVPGSDSKEPLTKLPKGSRPPMHQFLDAVAGSKDQPLVTPQEAAARVVVMEAIYKGARDHSWVNLS
ncbi:MAG TPA: Gfo/Idh/MocA family oxidoreductase [Candidatus Dormibacteraeota bacterium]|nr:Gfo/Idh/MocA family oxidoreductase [Candidatus Dormibacteraeota bacterium]